MEVTYQLYESEFDQKIFKSIKAAFKNRLIKVSVSVADNDSTTHQYPVSISYNALNEIVDKLENDDSFDLMETLEKFKTQ